MSKKLSALVITKNESATIARCLKSLAFADEIVVVDAESTDGTGNIARQCGATVVTNPWPGYGVQRNFGLSQVSGEWVVVIDADEEVSVDLAREITAAIAQPAADFYWVRVTTVFLGKPLRHLYGHNVRLFRRSAGHYSQSKVHEQIVDSAGHRVTLGSKESSLLIHPLLHYSHASIVSYLQKMHQYTTLDAQDMARTLRHRSGRSVYALRPLPWHLAARQFFKLLFYRRGILDGWAGIMWCVLSAYYEWEMGRKFLTLYYEQK